MNTMTPIPANISDGELSALVQVQFCPPVAWLIVKRGLFYRPDRKGYTMFEHEAGRFTLAEAKAEEDSCRPDVTAVQASLTPYATSADAVLPLLVASDPWSCDLDPKAQESHRYHVFLRKTGSSGFAPTFARCACFALLLSTGKFTLTTPTGTKAL